jgi:hypothetical protein
MMTKRERLESIRERSDRDALAYRLIRELVDILLEDIDEGEKLATEANALLRDIEALRKSL